MIHHYITKYWEDGKHYAEAWLQINLFGKAYCFSRRRIVIHETEDEINEMPSIDAVPQWIPVAERLPDLWDEKYLVSLAWGGVGAMEYKSTGFHNYGSFSPVPIETVTAWMPLPKPYERKEE